MPKALIRAIYVRAAPARPTRWPRQSHHPQWHESPPIPPPFVPGVRRLAGHDALSLQAPAAPARAASAGFWKAGWRTYQRRPRLDSACANVLILRGASDVSRTAGRYRSGHGNRVRDCNSAPENTAYRKSMKPAQNAGPQAASGRASSRNRASPTIAAEIARSCGCSAQRALPQPSAQAIS